MERGHRGRASSRRGDACPEASAGVLPSRQVESALAPSRAPMLPMMPLGTEWAEMRAHTRAGGGVRAHEGAARRG